VSKRLALLSTRMTEHEKIICRHEDADLETPKSTIHYTPSTIAIILPNQTHRHVVTTQRSGASPAARCTPVYRTYRTCLTRDTSIQGREIQSNPENHSATASNA
jgi:hypothetical protein